MDYMQQRSLISQKPLPEGGCRRLQSPPKEALLD
jgi:hypothetical protein